MYDIMLILSLLKQLVKILFFWYISLCFYYNNIFTKFFTVHLEKTDAPKEILIKWFPLSWVQIKFERKLSWKIQLKNCKKK